jgi:regulator of protease activity HflC (stomatin/prohibitin superfamily)
MKILQYCTGHVKNYSGILAFPFQITDLTGRIFVSISNFLFYTRIIQSNMAILYTIPTDHVVLVERFGKHSRIQTSGFRMKLPFIENIKTVDDWEDMANKNGYLIDLSEQYSLTPRRQFKTLDNITIFADLSIGWKIIDVVKATYGVEELPTSIVYMGIKALRTNVGDLYLDQILSERQKLNDMIERRITEIVKGWGIAITKLETYVKCDSFDRIQNLRSPIEKD